jgi:carbon monoxide dehydrogenase subunit G
MELVNEFRVPVSIDKAWEVLTDVNRIAPCIPGAHLLSVDGDDFTGEVKVKVGPITVSYKGRASFEDKDASAHRAVIRANGKETRGQGNAAAVVTAELKDEGDRTSCVLTTDLTISGKAAQFGRGVLADVATKLIGQFAERLEADVLAETTAPPNTQTSGAPTVSPASVDLLSVVAVPIARRMAPVAAGLAAGLAVGFLLGRRRP